MQLNEIQKAAQEQFGKQSERYGKSHILQDVSDVAAAVEKIKLTPNSEVLDVATGAGHAGLYLAGLGHKVVLADVSEKMLEQAQALATERKLEVETRQHLAEEFPHTSEVFDLVTCRVAAHHFSSPSKFVSEVARVLKPGGLFLLIDGTVEDGNPEAEEWSHQVEKLRDPSHHRFVTPNQWRVYCENNNLDVQHCYLTPFKQPDLNWYFNTAATPELNRVKVLKLVENAPQSARQLFRLQDENGKIVWWWQRLTLIACKRAA